MLMYTRSLVIASIYCTIAGCSRANNLFLGRVEAAVAGHTVVVTHCYPTPVPPPVPDSPGARFTPCRDADVVIHGGELIVNGRSYGQLARDANVIVDHGRVSVEPAAAR